jgi:protein O-mannosyl-transferase
MKIKTPFLLLFLSFVVLGVYYPTLFAPFSSVDDGRMVNALLNTDHVSLRSIFSPGGSGQYYRPLLYLTFLLDKFLWGLEESFMHLENIMLHLFNVVLVYLVAFRIQAGSQDEKKGVAFVAALLFALHPLNTEAVNWISGRTDVLACLFLLLSVLSLLHALQCNLRFPAILAVLFYFLACLAKESALFFLPGALVLIFSRNGQKETFGHPFRITGGRWFFCFSFLCVSGLYFVFRHSALHGGDRGIKLAVTHAVADPQSLWHNIFVMLKVAGFYARKLFVPMPLNFGIISVPGVYLLPGIALVFLALYWVWKRETVSALFLSAVTIGSSALIVSVAQMSWTPVAERYMYMPCALFSAAITIVGWRCARRFAHPRAFLGFSALVLVLFAWVTVGRNILWQDNLALAEDTFRKSPAFAPARNDIAIALLNRGRKEEALRIFESNDAGSFQAASLNRAMALVERGDLPAARKMLYERLKEPVLYQDQIIERIISVDEMIRDKSDDATERRKMSLEILDLLRRLHGITGDPFCFYRMGRVALTIGMKAEAGEYFAKAWQGAPEGAYYKAPAGKLARALSVRSGREGREKSGN